MSPERPLPWPLVLITALSCVLPGQPLPSPFQHHFCFFSGDALLARPTSPYTSRRPTWPPAWALSGYSRWESEGWPEPEGLKLLSLSGV